MKKSSLELGGKNPTLVFDFGDISENSVTFGPDTAFIRVGSTATSRDTTYHGKTIQGLDRLDSERDPFSRAFNAANNDKGLPGDVVNNLVVVYDTLPGQPPIVTTPPRETFTTTAPCFIKPNCSASSPSPGRSLKRRSRT